MKRIVIGIVTSFVFTLPLLAQDAPISPVLDEQLDTLVQITENLRGLETLEDVERQFPTRQETIAYLTEAYDAERAPAEWQRYELFYQALGLLEPDDDLQSIFLNLLGSQVAGFYDPATGVMNVLPILGDSPGDELSLNEQFIFVHEYTHALQDQHFNLTLLDSEAVNASPDAALAALSLIEGDAVAAMNLYAQQAATANPGAIFGLLAESVLAGNLTLPPGVPDILTRELLFPYEYGFAFVLALYEEGGWELINAAFSDLPQTSEQILHPDKYLSGEVGEPLPSLDLMPALDGDWTVVWDIPLGEFYLREYLRALGIRQGTANRIAAGWGGDRWTLYEDEQNGELVWTLQVVWDTEEDDEEFLGFWDAVYDRPAGSGRDNGCTLLDSIEEDDTVLCLYSQDGQTTLLQAPTLEQADALLPLLGVVSGA